MMSYYSEQQKDTIAQTKICAADVDDDNDDS